MGKDALQVSRRALLQGALGAGALAAITPWQPVASALSASDRRATPRQSRLFPGTRVVHADMHNHSHLSDGLGDPRHFFDSLREHGLDVAALTDHATYSWAADGIHHCGPIDGEPRHGQRLTCRSSAGLSDAGWRRTAELADAADVPGAFTAIRGFEWSSPALGHVNVWFSRSWIDPLRTAGWGSGSLRHQMRINPWMEEIVGPLGGVEFASSEVGMERFYDWVASDTDAGGIGGGADGLASFNHPGREPSRFAGFRPDPRVRDRFVAFEIFNGSEDYLFQGHAAGQASPLVECLNAGWRVGLIGVTDEHGTRWGSREGLGRGGMWVHELDRAEVRSALERRAVFATRHAGLRLDVAARAGVGRPKVRMGGALPHRNGPVTFTLDLDRGSDWWGRTLEVQVLRPAADLPHVAHVETVRVPTADEPLVEVTVDLDADDGDWVVLRVADPDDHNRQPGPDGHPCNRAAVAYASPFWLRPTA